MKLENLVEPFVYQNKINGNVDLPKMTRKERIIYARDYTLDILKRVWLYVIIGIGVGAWIHGYVPADFLAQYQDQVNGMRSLWLFLLAFLFILMPLELYPLLAR